MISAYPLNGVSGHYDARGTLTLTDVSGEHRDDITVALQENCDPDNPEPVQLEADEFVVSGFAGTFDTDHVEATVSSIWAAVCGTGELPHVGPWRVFARCTCGASDTQARLSYRSGDGPLASLPPALPHLTDVGIELDLGVVSITEVEGDHAWSGQVEVRGDTGADFEITGLLFMPATRYARVRAPFSIPTPTALVAQDGFEQTAGALTGKTAALGGTYAALTGSDSDDFALNTTDATVERSSVSDSGTIAGGFLPGRAVGLDLNMADVAATIDFTIPAEGNIQSGLFLRVVDASNFLFVRASRTSVALESVTSGSATGVGDGAALSLSIGTRYTLTVVLVGVNYYVYVGVAGTPLLTPVMTGEHPDLDGPLTSGDLYLYDQNSTATATPRVYDNLAAWVPEINHAIYADQSLRLTHEKAERENEAGTRWGRVPHFEGARLKVPPATRNGYSHRLVIKQDRNDLTRLPVGTTPPAELCTNPSAETDTTGWASVSAVTFERDTSLPTLDGLPAGVTTGFHLVTAGDAQGAFDDVAVESGKTYSFSAYAYLDSSTATGLALQVRNATGTVKATGATFSTLDDWVRINVSVTADATGTWEFRARQMGAGGADWYFAAVSIRQLLLTPALTVTPRVLLASG